MTIDLGEILTLIISGLLGGGLVGWYTSRSVVAKNLSEAAGEIVDSYQQRLKDVEVQQRRDSSFIRRQTRYISYLLKGIKILVDQVVELGRVPRWEPEDIDVVCPPEDDAA